MGILVLGDLDDLSHFEYTDAITPSQSLFNFFTPSFLRQAVSNRYVSGSKKALPLHTHSAAPKREQKIEALLTFNRLWLRHLSLDRDNRGIAVSVHAP